MLQKKIYSKLIQGLSKIKKHWDEDRATNQIPYEVDSQIASLIGHYRKEIRESGDRRKEQEIYAAFVDYEIKKGTLIRSPYGGIYFKIDTSNLPTREYFVQELKKKLEVI